MFILEFSRDGGHYKDSLDEKMVTPLGTDSVQTVFCEHVVLC